MYKWDDNKKQYYIDILSNSSMEDNFQNTCHDIIIAENSSDINNSLNRFCNILDDACSPLF